MKMKTLLIWLIIIGAIAGGCYYAWSRHEAGILSHYPFYKVRGHGDNWDVEIYITPSLIQLSRITLPEDQLQKGRIVQMNLNSDAHWKDTDIRYAIVLDSFKPGTAGPTLIISYVKYKGVEIPEGSPQDAGVIHFIVQAFSKPKIYNAERETGDGTPDRTGQLAAPTGRGPQQPTSAH